MAGRFGRFSGNRALFPIFIALGAVLVLNGASWWTFRVATRELEENFRRSLAAYAEFLARSVEIAYREDLDRGLRLLELVDSPIPGLDFEAWLDQVPEDFLRDLAPTDSPEPIFHDLYLLDFRGGLLRTWSGEWAREGLGGNDGPRRIHPLLLGDRDSIEKALARGEVSITPGETEAGGFFSTCYAPLRFAGEVRGAVGVRADVLFSDRLQGIRRSLILAAVFGSLLILALALMLDRVLGQLEAARSRMAHRERLAQLGQMVSVVAHEVRNPLGIIEQTVDLLRKKDDSEEKAPLLNYISEEVDRLNRMVGRFLEFARPSPSATAEGDERSADLSARVAEIHSLLLPQAEKKRLDFRLSLLQEPSRVRGIDDESLKQILLNLILNAFDSTPEGKRVEVGVREERGRKLLWVRDEGVGMNPEILRRAADPFFTTKEKGSGLGLSLVSKLVEEAGGSFEIESTPEEGCLVTISFKY